MASKVSEANGGHELWSGLRAHTRARIGIARSGPSLATGDALQLQLAHADAHDAIATRLHVERLLAALRARGHSAVAVRSQAPDRAAFIRRPDLGRLLDPRSEAPLAAAAQPGGYDVVVVIADGLSALAVERHALEVLTRFRERVESAGWKLAPVVVATGARVALADSIGAGLNARLSVILIGERPGLSCSDSLGVYITWEPRAGRTDAERNCISNIHPGGLSYDSAAEQLCTIAFAARAAQLTGTRLVLDSQSALLPEPHQ